mmetsp:Transcript_32221/g.67160  ORF Transcript_32221/g.67160 Transcript_32221/m.67160 type:complete len:98 (-) Transcript_32221:313-606(-)
MCYMKHSPDWLESSKSATLMSFMRRGDPCWFQSLKSGGGLCIDGNFLDDEGYSCSSYDDATKEDCQDTKDVLTQIPAKQACCECDGGTVYPARKINS